jgi:uncharacterized damage-inducible protein DinB
MSRATLADAFGHHAWATVRVVDACRDLDSQQLETSVPGTFGTVMETLRHLVGADASYLSVLTGRDEMLDEDTLDLKALRSLAVEHDAAWATLLSGELDEETIVVRHRDDGSESHAPMSIRLAQALHHGTDHRSQICTALTSLGLEPPLIDVWSYAWDHDRLQEIPGPG